MRQLDQDLADGTSFWYVLYDNLSQKTHKENKRINTLVKTKSIWTCRYFRALFWKCYTIKGVHPPPLSLSNSKVWSVAYLSAVVGAVLGEDVVDLWVLNGAENQRLPVVSGPVVQIPHPHSGKVDTVGVQRLQVHVLHHMLVTITGKNKRKEIITLWGIMEDKSSEFSCYSFKSDLKKYI